MSADAEMCAARADRIVRPSVRAGEPFTVRVWRPTCVALALLICLALAPVFMVIALLVKLEDRGPVLFRQERLGHRRVPFRLLKFRTMHVDNDDAIHREYVRRMLSAEVPEYGGESGVFKLTRDPRITRVGAVLRRSSLDELPQLWNVVRGDMTLVGPRPVLAYEAELFPGEVEPRFSVLPGITGMWQVSGRSAVDFRTALQMDCHYVARRSVRLDLSILTRTVGVLVGRSVAR